MWIVSVILTLFLIIVVTVFTMTNLDSLKWRPIDRDATYADPQDCSQFYNQLGVLRSCPAEQRFHEGVGSCRNYFLVDCGERYNPPMPEHQSLCEQYGRDLNWPTEFCNRSITCDTLPILHTCVEGYSFDIYTRTCLPSTIVDCGIRV